MAKFLPQKLRNANVDLNIGGNMSLGSNGNVRNTCLRILRNRGYEIKVEGELSEDGCFPTDALWIAEKDNFRFMGDNPIELLGLVAIYDYIQPSKDVPYWWRVDGTDIWSEVMSAAFPDIITDK
jgi:hypothetical protein